MGRTRSIVKAVFGEFAPDAVAGILKAAVEGKTTKEVYDFILNLDLWGILNPSHQQFLLGYKPWTLDWLTVEWVVNVIADCNKPGASVIATSPVLQGRISEELDKIKGKLG